MARHGTTQTMRQLAVRATKWHYLVRHIAGHCGNKIHVLCQCEARLTLNSYFIKIPLAKVGTLRDGTVLLFVCSFVCLSLVKFVKSFATWQHLTASGGFSHRL